MHAWLVEALGKRKKKNNCGKYPALSLWDMNLSIEREWNNNTGLCLTDGLLGKKNTWDSSWTRPLLGLSPAGLMVPVEPVGTSCLLETPMEMLAKIIFG